MVGLPFHAVISTWGGTTIGPLEVWKAWKELLLLALVVPTVVVLREQPDLRRQLVSSWLVRAVVAYTLLHVLAFLAVGKDLDAGLLGLAINLRMPAMFLLGYVAFWDLQPPRRLLWASVLVPAAVVVLFGILQLTVLPSNFLGWFGYQKDTISPVITIDEQPDQIRIMSTLRGPNPLGAYLILPIVLLLSWLLARTEFIKKRLKIQLPQYVALGLVALALALLVLYGSHARAAWLGVIVAVAAWIFLLVPTKLRLGLVTVGFVIALLTGFTIYQYRNNSFVQNAILHDNPETGAALTSNAAHADAIEGGLEDIKRRPLLGCGPGCAGPASFYNQTHSQLAENYYLQVAQEVGVLGLLLFLVIVVLVAWQLYQQRNDPLALVLLASLVGISFANLFLHVWADDTLAYVWWGLAGAVLGTTYTHSGSATASAKHRRTSALSSSRPAS